MAWSDNTFATDQPAELTEMPDGRIEVSWAGENGSRLTVIVTRSEFAALVDKGRALMGEPAYSR